MKIKNTQELPFDEIQQGNIKKRIFHETISNHELKWHFDKNDREVKILESNGWRFQMDNDLPKVLKTGDSIFIPKNKYHRVLKGNG